MHAISSYRGNRPTSKQTHRQGRLHYTAPQLSAQCNYPLDVANREMFCVKKSEHCTPAFRVFFPVWSPSAEGAIDKIETAQRRFTKTRRGFQRIAIKDADHCYVQGVLKLTAWRLTFLLCVCQTLFQVLVSDAENLIFFTFKNVGPTRTAVHCLPVSGIYAWWLCWFIESMWT